jgi:SAM-dependent methyltransferase
VAYYSKNRQSIDDVYPSEDFFLRKVIQPDISVLDVGCATGGFYQVFRTLDPSITYTGVDFSREMVRQAKKNFPQVSFAACDGGALPFRAETFDVVYCSGAIHLAPNWRDIIRSCWRVAKKFFIFDVRLVEKGMSVEDITQSYEKIAFFDTWDGKSIVPYNILNVNDFLDEIKKLRPIPGTQQYYGYLRPVSGMAVTPYKDVCMTMCCLGKDAAEDALVWHLPIPYEKTNNL